MEAEGKCILYLMFRLLINFSCVMWVFKIDFIFRLFHYDAAKNKSKVLLDGLWFANGVALSPKEDFVLVSETARSQIRRYYLKGEKKGTDDIFVDGLPGIHALK